MCALVVVLLRRLGLGAPAVYVVPGVALWLCVHEAGVHATIAGVALALLLPTTRDGRRSGRDDSSTRCTRGRRSWSCRCSRSANAGVELGGSALERALDSPVTLGITTGLVVGKVVGITLFVVLALRLGARAAARRPDARVRSCRSPIVAGIGFTVSLFVAELSFAGPLLEDAKVGVLVASLVAAVAGTVAIAARRTIRE